MLFLIERNGEERIGLDRKGEERRGKERKGYIDNLFGDKTNEKI